MEKKIKESKKSDKWAVEGTYDQINNEISENKGDADIGILEIELFLDRLDGRKDLAAKLIGTFLKHFREKLVAIKISIDENNPKALHASSHSFKGMLLHFSKRAAELAYFLENMGGSGKIDIENANIVFDNLQIIIEQIAPKLEDFQHIFKDNE